MFQNNWGLENFYAITVYLRFFFVSEYRKTSWGPSKVSESFKCQVSKIFLQKNGISRFSVEFFCLGLKKNRWGTFRYIRKVQLSKNFMRKRAISLFSPFSRFTAYKIRWGTPLCFRILGTSKTFMLSRGGGGVVIFRWFLLASQYWKFSWVTPSTLRKKSGFETFITRERKITFFSRKVLSHSSRKIPGNHF